MAIFMGPDAYITPSWYATKRETGKVVPTWNYVAVHAAGKPQNYADGAASELAIQRLVAAMEPGEEGWRAGMLSEAKYRGLLRGIVAFRMRIDRLDAKLKLNQNRTVAEAENAGARQAALGNTRLAEMMRTELEKREG